MTLRMIEFNSDDRSDRWYKSEIIYMGPKVEQSLSCFEIGRIAPDNSCKLPECKKGISTGV